MTRVTARRGRIQFYFIQIECEMADKYCTE